MNDKELKIIAERLLEVNTYLKKVHARLVVLTTLHKDEFNGLGLEIESWLKEIERYAFPERTHHVQTQ